MLFHVKITGKLWDSSFKCVSLLQVAQQDAQRSVFFVDRAIQEKAQKIVQAEGEATAAELISFLYFIIYHVNLLLLTCPVWCLELCLVSSVPT